LKTLSLCKNTGMAIAIDIGKMRLDLEVPGEELAKRGSVI
jgi:hypothetical protein